MELLDNSNGSLVAYRYDISPFWLPISCLTMKGKQAKDQANEVVVGYETVSGHFSEDKGESAQVACSLSTKWGFFWLIACSICV